LGALTKLLRPKPNKRNHHRHGISHAGTWAAPEITAQPSTHSIAGTKSNGNIQRLPLPFMATVKQAIISQRSVVINRYLKC